MILLALLVVSIAQAQSTGTISISLDDELKISNLGKAVRELESGRYRQTGRPTFANGMCFSDGTCLATAGDGSIPSTTTVLLSGSGTYTTPTGAKQLWIRMIGDRKSVV